MRGVLTSGCIVVALGVTVHLNLARPQQAGEPTAAVSSSESQAAFFKQYCVGCHNERTKSGGMSLNGLDLARTAQNPQLAERIIRKLRAGMMPPAGARRPEHNALQALAASLETDVDRAAAASLNPGGRPFQRLTRSEYARSIREMFGIDVDVTEYLPADMGSDGFDNVADVQLFSATLMDGYLRAATRVVRDALGDPNAAVSSVTYSVPRTASQMRYVDGAPFGTRGGIVVEHNFIADGDYAFGVLLYGEGEPFGQNAGGKQQIEIAVDGARVALIDIDKRKSEYRAERIAVKAGPRKISAAFIETTTGLVDDLLLPIDHTLAFFGIERAVQITTLPHLRDFTITGPSKVTGISETPARQRILTCRPASSSEEGPCATEIISKVARQAYRRAVSAEDLEGLMTFYEKGQREGDFESGIRSAIRAVLVSPSFLFRLERAPQDAALGQSYKVGDLELASRLSYFLWSGPPDAELIALAREGKLSETPVLEAQVRRMLQDPRAETISTRFAGQWLRLQDLDRITPDLMLYPYFDETLAQSMRRETELVFDSIVREDRNVLDLLNADYTFVNERLARSYGISKVVGSAFQRVNWNDENRRGILGHGSVHLMTSLANRTSPVIRGKWVMEVLLGTPPPPPPPNVPDLTETAAVADGKVLSVRKRLEQHRANPACNSCHRMIDPIGMALENFDVTGVWRIRDGGVPIDASATLYDGTELKGPSDLRRTILTYSEAFLRNFTEKLMTYGLGRRVEYHDMPLVRAIVREAARNDYRFSSFVLAIVKSPSFQMNTQEATTARRP